MFKSIKITVMAGVLGSSVLIGLGAAQAGAAESPDKCTDDGRGRVSCVDKREERVTSEDHGTIHLVDDMRRQCSGESAKVSCAAGALVGGEES